jgi:hypothetical protein
MPGPRPLSGASRPEGILFVPDAIAAATEACAARACVEGLASEASPTGPTPGSNPSLSSFCADPPSTDMLVIPKTDREYAEWGERSVGRLERMPSNETPVQWSRSQGITTGHFPRASGFSHFRKGVGWRYFKDYGWRRYHHPQPAPMIELVPPRLTAFLRMNLHGISGREPSEDSARVGGCLP